ncbi:hypothetical protein WR25_06997 [Diploscapter pachys]|uniref:Alpha-galactosidase n=1 Tax=Diploscapter pachys TaxID=2018661 RepID=A0A2A2LXD3_9BILA|nr:hypothetical protein WR25_06997 [Diploscapter pachys]
MGSDWNSIKGIINYMISIQDKAASVQGIGAFNDPDMLVVGNANITVEMAKTQFTVWCIWSVPLMISTDLRKLDQKFKDILLNREAISVNQDSMVKFGKAIIKEEETLFFVKPINPIVEGKQSYAVAVVNLDEKNEKKFQVKISALGLDANQGYEVAEIWSNKKMGRLAPNDFLAGSVPPTGSLFYKFIIANKLPNTIRVYVNSIH